MRRRAGYVGVQQAECEGKGCCWAPLEGAPWCYKPPPAQSRYEVTAVDKRPGEKIRKGVGREERREKDVQGIE